MKFSDIRPEAMAPPYASTSEHLRDYARMGIERLARVERFMAGLHRAGMADEARAKLLQRIGTDLMAHRVIDDTLTNGLAKSVAGFGMQLTMIGETLHQRLIDEDPNNQLLAQNLLQQQHMQCTWAKFGLNTFNLTSSLAAGLILTEPLPLSEENFALPFPAFCVFVPEGFLPFSYRMDGQRQWANVMWLHRFFSVDGTPIYQVTVECQGLTLYYREPLEKLEKYSIDSQHLIMEDDPKMTSDDDLTMTTALRIARNLVAWIHSNGLPKSVEQTGKRKKSRKPDPKDDVVPKTWFLGREVKFGPELRKMAQEVVLGLSKKTAVEGWKVRVRYVVRGHWRHQAHGVGRAERKTIWINPFWKGPEGAAAWSHIYEPNEAKEPEPKKE